MTPPNASSIPLPTPYDFGPRYAETVMGRFPVEPFNTYSNLIFLAIIIYFVILTRCSYKTSPFIVSSLPVLLIGYIGGTVYHATRSHNLWLIMDFMPIMILSFAAAVFLWRVILHRLSLSILAAILPVFIFGALRTVLPFDKSVKIMLGYSTLGLTILLPAILVSARRGYSGILLILGTAISFFCAVFFRQIDKELLLYLPMGTHFIWHLLGGVATWCIMKYVYLVENTTSTSNNMSS